MKAAGWAIKTKDKILVETVQTRRIGAMVNWLYLTGAYYPIDGDPDSMIEEEFNKHRKPGTEAVEIEIVWTPKGR